jgi:hypothetical protein
MICSVTLSLGLLSPNPSSKIIYKVRKFIRSGNEMLIFKTNYISFTSRSNNGGAKKKEGQDEIQFTTETKVPPTLEC